MHLIHQDFKAGTVRLKVTDPEDLWYLQQIIDTGDLITGKTTRKIKIGTDEQAKTVKKTYILTIESEKVEIDENYTSLRINGKVKAGPEEVPQNSYHTIALELHDECTLQKKNWLAFQKQKLKEAAEKKYGFLLCLFDREEMLMALTKPQGYEILVRLQGEVAKKRLPTTITKDFYQEIIKLLEDYALRYTPERIILASPAFYKEDLFQKIGSSIKSKIVLATCSDISERSLDEVLRQPELAKVLQQSRMREDQLIVEELLAEINKQELAVYGKVDVEKAVHAGAVRILLLTDRFIRQERQDNRFTDIESWMKQVDKQGEIHLISSEQESGQKLDGLGGIAALLRYKLYM